MAGPLVGPPDFDITSIGDSVTVEIGAAHVFDMELSMGERLLTTAINLGSQYLVNHDSVLQTTAVKDVLITLKYKHATTTDASLGFYRGALHKLVLLIPSR